jgi:hypothetical protein
VQGSIYPPNREINFVSFVRASIRPGLYCFASRDAAVGVGRGRGRGRGYGRGYGCGRGRGRGHGRTCGRGTPQPPYPACGALWILIRSTPAQTAFPPSAQEQTLCITTRFWLS